MPSAVPDSSFELADYVGVLRRRWWIVVAAMCLGTVIAGGYVAVKHKLYTSTGSVMVTANAANANQVAGSRTSGVAVNMDNEAQVVQSMAVAVPAARALHADVPAAKLVKRVSVTVPANTTVLQISCSAGTSTRAAQCANAFANAYLSAREAAAKGKTGFEATQLQRREQTLQSGTLSLIRRIRRLPTNSPLKPGLRTELKNTDAALRAVRTDIASLGTSVNYNPGYIITPASPPAAPADPRPKLDLPSGAVAGLLLGLVGAFIIDRRDRRLHSASDVERFLGLPVLLGLPHKKLILPSVLVAPRSAEGRAFTELAEAVGAGLGDGHHVVMVAASSPGNGGSVVAANLAAALARIRSNVLLVCADVSEAIVPGLLGVHDGRGLAELVTRTAAIDQVARRIPEAARMRVITPGVNTAALSSGLDYDSSRRLVGQLRKDARYVVIEGQAAGDGVDTFTLAEFADAAVVVTELGTTKKEEAADCIGRLDRMRTTILGAAVLPAVRLPRGTVSPAPAPKPAARLGGSGEQATPPAFGRSVPPQAERPEPANVRLTSARTPKPPPPAVPPARTRVGETMPLPAVQAAAARKENGAAPQPMRPPGKAATDT
jgi:capsular polysaccharide biosynthesis protein/Mrp family chromosome partitioning ATPase